MKRFSVSRQGVWTQRKLGSAQSVAQIAEKKKKRREMDYLKEMQQVMTREYQGPTVVDYVLVKEAKKSRETDRYKQDNGAVGYRVPAKSRDHSSDLDEVMSGLVAAIPTGRETKLKEFLHRPKGPERGSPDYEASQAVKNNFYAQALSQPPRKGLLSEMVVPKIMLDTFVLVVPEEGQNNMAFATPVVNGVPIVSKHLEDSSTLSVSSKWYQKASLLRLQGAFGNEERRTNVMSRRVMTEHGRNRAFPRHTLLDIAITERRDVVERAKELIEKENEPREKDKSRENTKDTPSVLLDFTTFSYNPFGYSGDTLTTIYFSTVGMDASEFGLEGNISVPLNKKLRAFQHVFYKHALRIAGVGELPAESLERIQQHKQAIVDYNNSLASEGGIDQHKLDSEEVPLDKQLAEFMYESGLYHKSRRELAAKEGKQEFKRKGGSSQEGEEARDTKPLKEVEEKEGKEDKEEDKNEVRQSRDTKPRGKDIPVEETEIHFWARAPQSVAPKETASERVHREAKERRFHATGEMKRKLYMDASFITDKLPKAFQEAVEKNSRPVGLERVEYIYEPVKEDGTVKEDIKPTKEKKKSVSYEELPAGFLHELSKFEHKPAKKAAKKKKKVKKSKKMKKQEATSGGDEVRDVDPGQDKSVDSSGPVEDEYLDMSYLDRPPEKKKKKKRARWTNEKPF